MTNVRLPLEKNLNYVDFLNTSSTTAGDNGDGPNEDVGDGR